jgi:hypothetical protein
VKTEINNYKSIVGEGCETVAAPSSFVQTSSIVQREHALVSPSSLKRTVYCTKSLKINEDYLQEHGEQSSAAALEGTKAHAVAENLVNERFGIPLQEDSVKEAADADFAMIACGQAYRDFVVRVFQGNGCRRLYTETKVDMTSLIAECWGTCDCFMVSKTSLIVVDYKYGKALVRAQKNMQLRAYSLGAYLSLPEAERMGITKVQFYIFQPRASMDYDEGFPRKLETVGAISHDEMQIEDLIAWAKETNVKVEQAIRNEGQFTAGEHCAFCAGKGTCPATRIREQEETTLTLADLLR